jgi:microcystin degradation protein MlrC
MLAGERLHMARVRLPLITPQVTQLTDPGEPLGDLMAEAEAMIGGDIATVSLLPGFAFADVADNGFCVLAGAWSSKQAAEQAANGMAERVWASRRRFKRQLTSIEEGTAHASKASDEDSSKRVILADVADNPGGGGRGNTTDIMKALVEAEVEGAVVGVFIDPEVVSAAWGHGIGSTFEATFAADDPTPHSKPFTCYVRVLALSEGSFMCRRPPLEGYPFDLGRTCLLQAGTVQVAVATIRQQTFSADLLEHCGVDVEAAATFVVKSRGHFRAGFTDLVVPSNIFEIDGPGLAPPNLTRVEWRGLQRPIYPLEPDTEWSPLLKAGAPV